MAQTLQDEVSSPSSFARWNIYLRAKETHVGATQSKGNHVCDDDLCQREDASTSNSLDGWTNGKVRILPSKRAWDALTSASDQHVHVLSSSCDCRANAEESERTEDDGSSAKGLSETTRERKERGTSKGEACANPDLIHATVS